MPSLRAVQRRLAAEIRGNAAGTPVPDDGFAGSLRLPPGTDPDSRLAVYRDGYPARIFEALEDAYPAIATICGDGSFTRLARRYLQGCDLSATSLNGIGEHFPTYCTRDELSTQLPFLSDLAHVEWAALRALHSTEQPPVDPTLFAAWNMEDWERVVLSFQPSTTLVRSDWPIHDLWQARDTPRDDIDIDLTDRAQDVLLYRRDYEVECRLLTRHESIALDSLLSGSTLGRTMETLAENDPGTDTSQMFGQWLATGLITSAALES